MKRKIQKEKIIAQSRLWLFFTSIIFSMIILFGGLFFIGTYLLIANNMINLKNPFESIPFVFMIILSVVLGAVLSAIVCRILFYPIAIVSKNLKKASKGEFDIRINTPAKLQEISIMYENFNLMMKELQSIETLRNDFVVSVSHEFKTPLSIIQGYVTLLQDENLSQDKKNLYIEKVLDSCKRLSTMVGNILQISKLENQEVVSEKKEYLLDEQIRQVLLSLESKWSLKNLEFDLELPKTIIYANEALIYQIWFNIISNAIKFSYDHSIISIKLDCEENNVTVEIKDQGIGMSQSQISHIFEKFYQCDEAHKQEGNGLGLALVKRIIDLCNGSINVESREKKGSKFIITLPLK